MVNQPAFLYVEDEPLSREIMGMMLQGLGYTQVTLFENSENFMQRIESLPAIPDVIFLDIHMQPHNGFEVLKALRQCPNFELRRIIAVTASVMNEEVVRLRSAGFDGAIGKPLDLENFADLIRRVLTGERVWHIT